MIATTTELWIYLALCVLPFILAMAVGGIKLHSPIFLFFLPLILGVFIKGSAIAWMGNEISYIGENDRILLMLDVDVMVPGYQAALLSIVCFFIGYFALAPTIRIVGSKHEPTVVRFPMDLVLGPDTHRRMMIFAILILSTAMILIVLYFIVADENPFNGPFSRKRFLRTEIGSKFIAPEYYIFKLAMFAKISCYLLFLCVLFGKRTRRNILLFIFSVVFFATMMIYFSIRSHIFILILDFVVLASIAGVKFFNLRGAIVGLLGFALLFVITALRRLGARIQEDNIPDFWTAIQDVLVSILQAKHFMDVSKIAHFIDAIPERIPFHWGETLYSWIFLHTPVTVGMTYLEIGPFMSAKVFNEPWNGVTPGLTAELYFNFGWYGIVIGTFLMGFFLRQVRRLPCDSPTTSAFVTLIYAMIIVRMTILMFNSSFGASVIALLIDLIPMMVLWPLLFWRWMSTAPSARAGSIPAQT